MNKKPKTTGNIRFKQRSKKRGKRLFQWPTILKAILLSALMVGALWGIQLLQKTSLRLWQNLPLSSHATIDEIGDIIVHVIPQEREQPSGSLEAQARQESDLMNSIRQDLWGNLKNRTVDKQILTRAANAVWKANSSIERLSLVESSLGQIVAQVSLRLVKFGILAEGATLALSAEGTVYRSKNLSDPTLIFLSFDAKARLDLRQAKDIGNHLLLPEGLQQSIQQFLQLAEMLKQEEIQFEKAYLDSHRGLEIHLAGDRPVVFGWAPYDRKMKRLRTILERYGQDLTNAARIELDFQDKAFIQEMQQPKL